MRIRFDCFGEKSDNTANFVGTRITAGPAMRGPVAESTGDADCGAEPLGAIIKQLLDGYSRRFPQMHVQIVDTPSGCVP